MNTKVFSLYSKVINIKYKSQKYTRLRMKIIKRSIHDYTVTLINREKIIIFFENWMVLICKKLSPLHTRIHCFKFGSNLGPVVRCRRFCKCNFYLLLEKDIVHHLNNLKSPLPQDILCQSLVNLKHSTSLREIYILFTSNSLSLRTILFLNVNMLYMLVVFYKKT